MIIETHKRTLAKAVIYRVLSVAAIMGLSLMFGASTKTAGLMGIAVVIIGTTIYYVHERVWLQFNWLRNEGYDKATRSIIKTIIYRALTMVAMFIIAKLFMTESNASAILFSIAQSLTNMCLFFIIERLFNNIAWGKVVKE